MSCVVCGRSITARDERLALPHGGHVHRGCATYRMRRALMRSRGA